MADEAPSAGPPGRNPADLKAVAEDLLADLAHPDDGPLRIGRARCRLQTPTPADAAGHLAALMADLEVGLKAEPDNPSVIEAAYARIGQIHAANQSIGAECARALERLVELDVRRTPR